MRIIILRIPDTTTQKQVRSFVKDALCRRFRIPFTAKPTLDSCEIIQMRERNGVIETHALCDVTPDDQAEKIIRRLRGKQLNGKAVQVRQHRNREMHSTAMDPLSDRRRVGLKITKRRSIKADGIEQFSRKIN